MGLAWFFPRVGCREGSAALLGLKDLAVDIAVVRVYVLEDQC